jgi:hypothetical protein
VSLSSIGGFQDPIGFGVTGLPAGATASFGPGTVVGTSVTTMTVNTISSTPTGASTLTVTATSGSHTHNSSVGLSVGLPSTTPPTLSVSPSSGSGASQVFSLTVTDSLTSNSGWAELLINNGFSGFGGCYLHYDVAANVVYLHDDGNPNWFKSGVVGTGTPLSNNQCTLDVASSSVSTGGTAITLNLALSFAPPFAGSKVVYSLGGSGAANSGWQQLGTWTVSTPSGLLPAGWGSGGIGMTDSANQASYSSGVFTVSGKGADIELYTDSFEFAYQPLVGDGSIVARLSTNTNG